MNREWVVQIKRRCREAEVPFFFKQWGGVHKKEAGRELFGKTYDEMPIPQVRQKFEPLLIPSNTFCSV
jgi:protein gp37